MIETLTAIFVVVDDFCKEFEPIWNKTLIEAKVRHRVRNACLSLSEIMAILIAFQSDGSRNFKKYYMRLCNYHRSEFPCLPSYNRFIELKKSAVIPLFAFFSSIKGTCTGISFIDATALSVCKTKRVYNHKIFKGIARWGKTTMGWFYGFKLHLVVNSFGHPLSFIITQGNVDDRSPVEHLTKSFWGKIYGDKGYIKKELFEKLFSKGIQLITAQKTNMKTKIMTKQDSENLKKRSGIESIFNILKNVFHLEHSRHRSIEGFVTNIVSCICRFSLNFIDKFISLLNNTKKTTRMSRKIKHGCKK